MAYPFVRFGKEKEIEKTRGPRVREDEYITPFFRTIDLAASLSLSPPVENRYNASFLPNFPFRSTSSSLKEKKWGRKSSDANG